MSRENPASPAWAEYYRHNPGALANWAETNGLKPDEQYELMAQARERNAYRDRFPGVPDERDWPTREEDDATLEGWF
jgi:hypothetical protein